jgi:hypothetical protein
MPMDSARLPMLAACAQERGLGLPAIIRCRARPMRLRRAGNLVVPSRLQHRCHQLGVRGMSRRCAHPAVNPSRDWRSG